MFFDGNRLLQLLISVAIRNPNLAIRQDECIDLATLRNAGQGAYGAVIVCKAVESLANGLHASALGDALVKVAVQGREDAELQHQ